MALVITDYLDIQDGDFGPEATWYVGANSINSGNNYNVFFEAAPASIVIESLSITETLTAVVLYGGLIQETVTNTDLILGSLDTSASQDETGTSTDNSERTLTNYNAVKEETGDYGPLATQQYFLTNSGFGVSGGATGSVVAVGYNVIGSTFIPIQSGRLGEVVVSGSFNPIFGDSVYPTQPGTVELWQLDSNSLSGTPQTLITSLDFPPTKFPTNTPQPVVIADFSDVVAAQVTSGVGYAIVVRYGSDWNSSKLALVVAGVAEISTPDTTYADLSKFTKGVRFSSGVWQAGTHLIPFIDLAYQTTTTDTFATELSTSASSTETATSTETSSSVNNTAVQRAHEGIFINVGGQLGFTSNTNFSNGFGFVFTAPRTTSLGTLRWRGVYGGSGAVSDGIIYVRLYNATYSTGVLGSLIVEKQIPVTTGTSYFEILNNINLFDQGFNVTSAQSYGVTVTWSVAQLFGGSLSSSYYQGTYLNYYKPSAGGGSGLPFFLMSFSDEGALESSLGGFTAAASQSETGTSTDSSNNVISVRRNTHEPSSGDGAVELMALADPTSGYGITPTVGHGVSFIATRTGRLGIIKNRTSTQSSGPARTTSAKIQLWSLSSNSITASPSVKLAEIDLPWQDFGVLAKTILGDFSNTVGADVIAGNAYAVLIVGGSDWSTSVGESTMVSWVALDLSTMGPIVNDYKTYRYNFNTSDLTFPVDLPLMDVEYATTNTDNITTQLSTNASSTETVSNLDSSTSLRDANTWITDSTNHTYVDSISGQTFIGNVLANASGSTVALGAVFLANKSGQIGQIRINGGRVQTGQPQPTQPVKITLWNVNQITNVPTTEIASVSIPFADLPTAYSNSIIISDFSSLPAAQVVLGTKYGVTIEAGSDWNGTTTDVISVQTLNDTSGKNYVLSYYGTGLIKNFSGILVSSSNSVLAVIIEDPNTTVDSLLAGFDQIVDRTETGTAADSSNRTYRISRTVDELNSSLMVGTFGYARQNLQGIPLTTTVPARGITFLASSTSQLGVVKFSTFSTTVNGSGIPTTDGTIELWQTASNAVTALPQTLLASIPLKYVNGPASWEVDFSTVAGASVVSGTGYAIILRAGSDWDTTGFASMSWYAVQDGSTGYDSQVLTKTRTVFFTTDVWNLSASVVHAIQVFPANATRDEQRNTELVTITETTSVNHSQDSTETANAFIISDTDFVNTIKGDNQLVTWNYNTLLPSNALQTAASFIDYSSTTSTDFGYVFTADKTELLDVVRIPAMGVPGQGYGTTTTVGAVEVRLAGPTGTLLGSVSLPKEDLRTFATVAQIPSGLLGSAGLTQLVSGSVDDTFTSATLPFNISFCGTSYNIVHIGSNSYLTFGSGSGVYQNLSPAIPSIRKIMISSADNSYQQVFAGAEGTAPNRTYRIRFEGTGSTSGTVGNPNMVWEATFYEATPTRIDIQIGVNTRAASSAITGVFTSDTRIGYFTPAANSGYTITTSDTSVLLPTVTSALSNFLRTFDFRSQNITLNQGTTYFVGIKGGDTWSRDNFQFNLLHDTAGPSINASLTNIIGRYNTLISSYSPRIRSSGTWANITTRALPMFEVAPKTSEDFIEGGYSLQVDQSETGTLTDDQINQLLAVVSATETLTGNDSSDNLVSFVSAITEANTSQDSSTNVKTSRVVNAEGGIVVDTFLMGLSNTALNTVSQSTFGINFTAPKTTTLDRVSVWMVGGGTSTSDPQLQLLQGASVIASKTIPYSSITNSGLNRNDIDVTGLGFTLTQGVNYTIRITTTGGGLSYRYWMTNNASFGPWNANTAISLGITASGVGSNNMPVFTLYENVNTDEALGGFDAFANQDESVTSSEQIDAISLRIEYIDENLSSTDEQTSIVQFVSVVNELLSAIDTPIGLADFISSLTETGSLDDAVSSSVLFDSSRTETGTAEDTQDNIVTFTSDITETGSSESTEVGLVVFVGSISETVTADENSFNVANFVTQILESLTNEDNVTANYSSEQSISETGTAEDTQINIVSFVSDITETGTLESSEVGLSIAVGLASDSLTATEESFNITSFVSSITETGNTEENITGNYSSEQYRTETGTANDTQNNIVTFETSASETINADSNELSQADFVSFIDELISTVDSQENYAIFQGLQDETLTALEFTDNSTVFVSQLVEQILSEDFSDNFVAFVSELSEAIDPTSSENVQVDFVAFGEDMLSANDESFNVADRIADVTEQLFSVEFSETQVAFVSELLESLTAEDNQDSVFVTFQDVIESITVDANEAAFVEFVGNILETIASFDSQSASLITDALANEIGIVTDSQSNFTTRLADLTEALQATESSVRVAVFNTLINEIGLSQDQITAFLLVVMDWDTLAYHFAHAEWSYDDIYVDNIDVLYGEVQAATFDVLYDDIYLDDIEVLYGNAPTFDVDDDGNVNFRYVA